MKPILFNTEMVRAILDGRKTETRRVIKGADPDWPLEWLGDDAAITAIDRYGMEYAKPVPGLWATFEALDHAVEYPMFKAPYEPGDILYVRETWQYGGPLDGNEQFIEPLQYFYAADGDPFDCWLNDDGTYHDGMKWRPSIHMPKEAARLFLRVTDVRVERLQDIDETGALAEGLYKGWQATPSSSFSSCARQAFMWLWNRLTGKGPRERTWLANPWVWVICFEPCEKPEEEAP
jgi:hypothetical protein